MDYTKAEAKQAARECFTGLWAATTTPFDSSGGLDADALRRDLDRLTGSLGVGGIFCGGVMGEFWSLAGSERRRVVEITVDATRGKCPVIAHTGHTSARQAIELTRHAQKAGADFAVLINPYFPPASDEGLYQWFKTVAGAVDIGVWLFDTAYSGVSLSLELIERLAAIENVCGIKVGRDHARYLEVLDRVGGEILVCEPTRAPGWRTCATTASGCSCPRPRRTCTRRRSGSRCASTPGSRSAVTTRRRPRWRPRSTRCARWPPSGCTARRAGSTRWPPSRPGPAWSGCPAGRSARRCSPQTRAELGELTADLDAVGLLSGTGSSRRVSSDGHRPTLA